VESYTAAVADPRMPIPLPDQTNDPPGTHIPPMTPPPIARLPTPTQDSEEKLINNTQITVEKIRTSDLDIQTDLGLGPDVEYDEDGAPIIKPKPEEFITSEEPHNDKHEESKSKPEVTEKRKVNILDQIENEIQQKIKSQEAAKAAAKSKAEPLKNNIADKLIDSSKTSASEAQGAGKDKKSESPNPEDGERESKRIKIDGTPPQETNQPATPIKPFDLSQQSSSNGYNPLEQTTANSILSPPFGSSPTSQPLGPVGNHTTPHIPYSTQSAPPQISQTPYHVPISHQDPVRMHPNQPYPYEPMPNREHYYPMQAPIPNQPPMIPPMQQNFYPPPPTQISQPHFPTQQHQPPPSQPPPAFPNQKQSRFFPYTGYATPIHTFNDTVEPGPDGRLPLDYWTTMSCTVEIPNCPLNCCHVRAHQEIMEGSTNWKAPYGPPLNGLQPCSCCINSLS